MESPAQSANPTPTTAPVLAPEPAPIDTHNFTVKIFAVLSISFLILAIGIVAMYAINGPGASDAMASERREGDMRARKPNAPAQTGEHRMPPRMDTEKGENHKAETHPTRDPSLSPSAHPSATPRQNTSPRPTATVAQVTLTTAPAEVIEVAQDPWGYINKSTRGPSVLAAGAKVWKVSSPETFAVVYNPSTTAPSKVLILLHGTGGTAYDEVADELSEAQKNGYGLIGIQWLKKETNTYFTAANVNTALNGVMAHWQTTYGRKPTAVLLGFSRGGAVSYEVSYRDQQGANWINATAAMSGGVPLNAKVEAKTDTDPDVFFSKMIGGTLESNAYSGHHYFFYCGMKDEEWGTQMCAQIENANTLVKKYGGTVDVLIEDQNGKHGDFRKNTEHRQKFITWLLSL